MRLYQFSHFMLSTMVKGIQNTHSAVELFTKYDYSTVESKMIFTWSEEHKTIISLNAGTSVELNELVEFFKVGCKDYPWSFFQEDESLHEIITSVSIVLPEKIYVVCELVRQKRITLESEYFKITNSNEIEDLNSKLTSYGNYSDFDVELVQRLCKYSLAS